VIAPRPAGRRVGSPERQLKSLGGFPSREAFIQEVLLSLGPPITRQRRVDANPVEGRLDGWSTRTTLDLLSPRFSCIDACATRQDELVHFGGLRAKGSAQSKGPARLEVESTATPERTTSWRTTGGTDPET
jgi:hypothetical protein